MLEKLLRKLCDVSNRNFDAIVKDLGITDEELHKSPSTHRCVQIGQIFAMTATDVKDVAFRLELESPAKKTANEYTVCFLFDKTLDHVLLQRKTKTDFAGLWNGVGGSCKNGEDRRACALREIQEETGVKPEDIENLTYVGTLTLPYDCKTQENIDCVLHYFTGIVDKNVPQQQPDEPELLEWHNTNYVRTMSLTSAESRFAGNGDLQFFVHMSVRAHLDYRKAQKAEA